MPLYQTVVCEDQRDTIQCANETTIVVVDAFYGSEPDAPACGDVSGAASATNITEQCESTAALTALGELCNGKHQCLLEAGQDLLGISNCSENATKHLKVSYACAGWH